MSNKRRLPVLLLSTLLGLSAFPLFAADTATTPTHVLNGHAVYGQPMTDAGKPVALSAALESGASEQMQLISGRIGQVCQKKGCWMMLIDGDQAVRVMFGKDDFFIPTDTTGEAIVHGRLEEVEMSQGQAEHMAKDGGGDAKAAQAGKEWRIVADSVLIKASA